MARPSYTQTAAPTVFPLTVDEARLQCKYDDHDLDSWFDMKVKAATQYAQDYQWSQLIESTWEMRIDRFPCVIELHPAPLLSFTSLKYVDTSGTLTTLTLTTDYMVDQYSKPARVLPAYGKSWPATRGHINDVLATFTAGYGTGASSVPVNVKQAMLMLIEEWYDREIRELSSERSTTYNGLLDKNSFRVFY